MNKIDIESILRDKVPNLFVKYPKFISAGIVKFLSGLLKISEINKFQQLNGNSFGIDFINNIFDYLNFSYVMSERSRTSIPSEGKVVIVSNHPLGGLDGLALLKAVHEVRQDVKIIANDILMQIDNLKELFLPFDLFTPVSQKENIKNIEQAILNDECVIFFPAGEVSRMSWGGIKDGKWKKGAIRFATKSQSPILPAFVEAKNSFCFYFLSMLWRRTGMFLLPRELFLQRNKQITIKFGDLIPPDKISSAINQNLQMSLIRQHTYRIGKGKKGIFATEKTIIHPVPVKLVKSELVKSDLLGQTSDGMKIYLCKKAQCPNVLKEISRLRETTFRKVGEGTGKSYDTDIYDDYYHHIVLWDEEALEIAGSYRLGITSEVVAQHGIEGLYNASQFHINPSFNDILSQSIELGRSFIQQKYWRSNALDYIWQGIGAFVQKNPSIRYLWGAVSLSNAYPEAAKALIVSYYQKWYQGNADYATPMIPYQMSKLQEQEANGILVGETPEQDMLILKKTLKAYGLSVPVLYRRYTELCNYGGARFVSFCIDVKFMNAIDGIVLVDLTQLKDEYKERYYGQKSFESDNSK